jgi:hypothetical protein
MGLELPKCPEEWTCNHDSGWFVGGTVATLDLQSRETITELTNQLRSGAKRGLFDSVGASQESACQESRLRSTVVRSMFWADQRDREGGGQPFDHMRGDCAIAPNNGTAYVTIWLCYVSSVAGAGIEWEPSIAN